MIIAAIGVVIIYKLHFWVERTFKIDDAVGAVAVHGYAGFYGVVIAGSCSGERRRPASRATPRSTRSASSSAR